MKVDIKTRAQIDRMREACRMSAEIRDICAAAVAPGVTTGEIDDLVVDHPRLQVPHPLMFQRDFVMRPLAEIAPDWRPPGCGKDG